MRRWETMEGWEFTGQCGERGGREAGVEQGMTRQLQQRPRTNDGPSGLGPFAAAWAMATSPAWPLPAEGAQGLCISQLSREAKQDGKSRAGKVPLGREPQAEPRQQLQNPPTWGR